MQNGIKNKRKRLRRNGEMENKGEIIIIKH